MQAPDCSNKWDFKNVDTHVTLALKFGGSGVGLWVLGTLFLLWQQSRAARLRRQRALADEYIGIPFGVREEEEEEENVNSCRKFCKGVPETPVVLPLFVTFLRVAVILGPVLVVPTIIATHYLKNPAYAKSEPLRQTKHYLYIGVQSVGLGSIVFISWTFTSRGIGKRTLRNAGIAAAAFAAYCFALLAVGGVVDHRRCHSTVTLSGLASANLTVLLSLALIVGVFTCRASRKSYRPTAALAILFCLGSATGAAITIVYSMCRTQSCQHLVLLEHMFGYTIVSLAALSSAVFIALPFCLLYTMILETRYWRQVGRKVALDNGMKLPDEAISAIQPLLESHVESQHGFNRGPGSTRSSSTSGSQAMLKWIDWAEVEIGQVIGRGAQGKVTIGVYRGRRVAVKFASPADMSGVAVTNYVAEALATQQLAHETSVQLLGIIVCPPNLCLVLELCEGGSVRSLLARRFRARAATFDGTIVAADEERGSSSNRDLAKTPRQSKLAKSYRPAVDAMLRALPGDEWTWHDVKDFAVGCIRCVVHLHSQEPRVVHRDLKTLNFLVTEAGTVKLADFGCAKQLPAEGLLASGFSVGGDEGDPLMTGLVGSPFWMAPEVITDRDTDRVVYDERVDIYSYGIVLWELVTGRAPYAKHSVATVMRQVHLGKLRPDIPEWCPTLLSDLMQRCWHQDPAQRPSAQHVLSTLESWESSGETVPVFGLESEFERHEIAAAEALHSSSSGQLASFGVSTL